MTDTELPSGIAEHAPRPRLDGSFWRLWSAHGLANLADSIGFVGVGLIALTLTSDERLLAVTTAMAFAAWIVMALPAGVVVDRLDRQQLMVSANLIRVGAFGAVAVLAVRGDLTIWTLLVLVALGGTAEVIFDSTGQAVVPMVARDDQLARANGLFFTAELVAGSIIGLAIGAVLFDWGAGVPFAVMAIGYSTSALLILTTAFRYVPPVDLAAPATRGMRTAARWLWRHDLLRTLAVLSTIGSFSYMLMVGILAKFAVVQLGLSSVEFGLLVAVNAIGAAAAGLAAPSLIDRVGDNAALTVSYTTMPVCLITMGVAGPVWVIATAFGVAGFMLMVWNIAALTARQHHIPADQFGRINAVFRFAIGVSNVAGIVTGGFLARASSLEMPFIAGGVVMALCGVAVAVPLRRLFATPSA